MPNYLHLTLRGLKAFTLFCFMLSCFDLSAQNCAQANITLSTQTEIDNFQTTYGGGVICTTVTGNLIIRDDNNGIDNIINLNGLSDLTSVGADLDIKDNGVLNDINGLSSITNLGEDLDLSNNGSLTNVNGLSNLLSLGDDLDIVGNSALTNLDGLSNLMSVSDNIELVDNSALININGLSNLISMIGDVEITNNNLLANLDGLSNIPMIMEKLIIQDNNSLTNINGLSNLSSIGDDLTVTNNPMLAECCGLFPVLMGGGAGVTGTITMSGNLAAGNCNNNGTTVATACPVIPVVAAVPTLGEWSLLILTLLMSMIGFLFSVQPKLSTEKGSAYLPTTSFSWYIPFDKMLFFRIAIGCLFFLTLLFSVGVNYFDYELTIADVPMSLITCFLFAFMAQSLFIVERNHHAQK